MLRQSECCKAAEACRTATSGGWAISLMGIGYGTYGMPDVPVIDAIEFTARIGYTGIELAAMPGWPAAPEALDTEARRRVREQLSKHGLTLTGLMTALEVLSTEDRFQEQSAYLRDAALLGKDLDDTKPPVLIATIGGPVSAWATHQQEVVDRVAAWCEVCAEEGALFALEPHVMGVLHTPQQAEALRVSVDSPALKYNFDISHFVLQDIPVMQCIDLMAPHAVHTHVKDAVGDAAHVKFLLPGEGDFDYPGYLRAMANRGYDGFITVEVSGMIWNAPGYDPIAAAEFSYKTLRKAFVEAGVLE